jgi:hypothetical protein
MDKDRPTPDADRPEPGEGGGERTRRGRGDLAELRLYKLALKQGWVIPPELKRLGVEKMGDILRDPKGGARAHTAAMRCLIAATTATTSAIGTAIQARQSEELAETVARLEADVHVLQVHRGHRGMQVEREDDDDERLANPDRAAAKGPPGPEAADPESGQAGTAARALSPARGGR